MAKFIQNNRIVLVSLSAGAVIGAGVLLLYVKWRGNLRDRQIALLLERIESLKNDVAGLKSFVEEKLSRKRGTSGFYSVHASSGEDDDDIYEDAYSETRSLSSNSYPRCDNGTASLGDFFHQVDQLLEGQDKEKTQGYNLLKDREPLYSADGEYLWRLSKSAYLQAQIEGTTGREDSKKALVYSAHNYAQLALHQNEASPSAHKWYAITLGSIGDYEGTQAKIKNGYNFKTHIERAIELNPRDPSSYYLLGRWCYGVYMLTWIERKIASSLFATPPSSTVEEALTHFSKAEELSTGPWKENMLFIAKCYLEQRDYTNAIVWIDKAFDLPIVSQDDRTSQAELEVLVNKYSGYRS